MKILFTLGHGYLPQAHGGLLKSIDQLARELITKGNRVAVLASLVHGGTFAHQVSRLKLKTNQILINRRLCRDTVLSYPVWRTWFPWGRPGHIFPDREIRYVQPKKSRI